MAAIKKSYLVILFMVLEFSRVEVGAQNRFDSRTNSRLSSKSLKFAKFQTMDDVYNVYDSTFLGYLWPKLRNGVHLDVDPVCFDRMGVLFKDLMDGKFWAYKVVDASGRYQSGLFEGNHYWLGSKAECMKLNEAYRMKGSNETLEEVPEEYMNVAYLRTKYYDTTAEDDWLGPPPQQAKMSTDHVAPPYPTGFFTVNMELNVTKPYYKSYGITLGLCLPQVCACDDVKAILHFSIIANDNLKTNKTSPRAVKINSVRTVLDGYSLIQDPIAIMLIVITALLSIIIIIGTAVDFDLVKLKPKLFKTMSFDLNPTNEKDRYKAKDKSFNNIPTLSQNIKDSNVPIHRKNYVLPYNEKAIDIATLDLRLLDKRTDSKGHRKAFKPDIKSPAVTLEVITADDLCKERDCDRCGKYKKQCSSLTRNDLGSGNDKSCSRNDKSCSRNDKSCSRNDKSCSRNDKSCSRRDNDAEVNIAVEANKWDRYNFLKSVIVCFSLRTSWRRLSNTNLANRDMAAVHLMKILVVLWIVYVDVVVVMSYISNNAGNINDHNTAYNTLLTGTLSFDCLFFISGVLSANHLFYLRSRYTVEQLVSFGGVCGRLLQAVCFVTNRVARLIPAYFITMMLTSVLSARAQHIAPITFPERDADNCALYWWRNLLYVNSFYPDVERCMQVSWLLSLESQLHAAAVAALCACGRRRALVVAAAALLAAAGSDLAARYTHHGGALSDSFAAYEWIVNRPWARVAPYFTGAFTGWLLHRLDGKLYVSGLKCVCLWTVSLWGISTVLLLPWCVPSLGAAGDAVIASLTHVVATASLVWPVVVLAVKCSNQSTRLLANPVLASCSRVTYCVILLHGAIVRGMVASLNAPLTLHAATIWSFYCGVCVASWLSAFLLSLLVETPCCSLLRRLSDVASS